MFGVHRTRLLCLAAALVLALLPCPLRADDFVLKDGRKISGTIVGFENGMFRVETEFGFVLIRKDKVATVVVTSGSETHATAPASAATPESKSTAPHAAPAEAFPAAPPAKRTPPPAPVSRPLDEPLPEHIAEHVEGTSYVNDTFGFSLYKPPQWKLFEELHREQVSAIVAMSSEDEQTLLFVYRQAWSGTPDLKDDSIEASVRRTYEEFKKLSETTGQLDGMTALRRTFTGVLDGVEWHGVAVRVAHGNTVFGLVGLTSAEMYQFQLAVLNKMIDSFHFVGAAAPASASNAGVHSQ